MPAVVATPADELDISPPSEVAAVHPPEAVAADRLEKPPLSDCAVDDLVSEALTVAPCPLPNEYKKIFAKARTRQRARQRARARARQGARKKARKPASKRDLSAEAPGDLSAMALGLDIDKLIALFSVKRAEVDAKKLCHRFHSKVWHHIKGKTGDKDEASRIACSAIAQWRAHCLAKPIAE